VAPLARWDVVMQDRCFAHRTLLTKEAWEALFTRHGLRLCVSRRIVSPRLTRLWDLLLPLALPGWLLGLRRSWRPAWLARRLARWLERHAREESGQGSVLFFIAEKPDPATDLDAALVPPGATCGGCV
jgi:hypothetical protein